MVTPRSLQSELAADARPVLWLSSAAPPPVLQTHLARHGLCLQTERDGTWPSARLTTLETCSSSGHGFMLGGRRLAVLHADPGEADQIAQVVRGYGAQAQVVGLRADRLDRLEAFDADAVLVESESFYDAGWNMVSALWSHARLRWLPLVMMPSEHGMRGAFATSDLSGLGVTLSSTLAAWDEVRLLSLGQKTFQVPLHALGPLRTLRALMNGEHALRATFMMEQLCVDADIEGGQLVSLRGRSLAGGFENTLDRDGLSWLLSREVGTVQVEPRRASSRPPARGESLHPPSSTLTSGVRPTLAAEVERKARAAAAREVARPARSRHLVPLLLLLASALILGVLWAQRLYGVSITHLVSKLFSS